MVGRGFVSLLGAALVLGLSAPVALSEDSQRMVMVEHSPFMIQQLEAQGYDVGFVGEKYEAGVYVDDAGEAKLRAAGYKIGQTLEDQRTWHARKAEIAKVTQAESLASEFARKGIPASGVKRNGKTIVPTPGNIVIQRAYTFTNYAGRFLYLEAHNKAHNDTGGPAMSMTFSTDGGATFRPPVSLSNSNITPDGNDAGIGGNKVLDTDAASNRYMYHRGMIALRGDDANLQASQITVRVADAAGNTDTSGATEWAGKGMPPRAAGFQKDFITKYMDPTEVYNRMDALSTQYSDIMQTIELPNKTDGYQRPGMAMMEGGTVAPGSNPSTANNAAAIASRSRAVQLFSKALGHQGGNSITAEFKAPAAGTASAPLSITVTDGTWTTHDPEDTDATDGIRQITFPTKDIVVNLPTDATGALTATAAQIKAAINADPAASQLVTAYLYGNTAGDGIVAPTPSRTYTVPEGTTNAPATQTFASTKVKLSDFLRGGTVYWAGSFPTTASPLGSLVRTDARHIQKGPFNHRVYRIGKDRSNNAVGVFFYCQQHAREWVTPITCLETAERLVRNYATDPTTKEYVDRLNIFILPSANPDGGHYSFHDGSVQRKNLRRSGLCLDPEAFITNANGTITSYGGVGNRTTWGTDSNRNNTVGSLFDGFAGASTSCTSDTFSGPTEASEPEIRNEHWIGDTFQGVKFANNVHTHGGYFMWAPGAYISQGRVTLPAPNIGIERYFFDVADTILSHIKSSRGTVILPQRVGPIADTLYSAAGNSSDENWYKRGIIAYSFEAGAQRITVNPTTGAISRQAVGFQPCFGGTGTNGGQGATCNPTGTPPVPSQIVNEGHDSTMEFAEGNFGEIQGALEYLNDVTPPQTKIEYSSAQTNGEAINFKFDWLGEPSVIFYTTDGTAPTVISDNPATDGVEGCDSLPAGGSTRCYNSQGPRRPGEVLTLSTPGAYTVKWSSVDMKGNVEPVKTQRLLVAADDEQGTVGGSVPATLGLTLGAPASFGPFTPGVDRDYNASTTANVISTAGDATLSVADPSSTNTGKLMNGSFTLAQAVQAAATSANGTGRALAPVGGSANPTTLLTYGGPVSNDAVTVNFRQTIGRTEGLRTGAYSKTLTFTLSTTQP